MGFKGCVFLDLGKDWEKNPCLLYNNTCNYASYQPDCADYTEIPSCRKCNEYSPTKELTVKHHGKLVVAKLLCKCGHNNYINKIR